MSSQRHRLIKGIEPQLLIRILPDYLLKAYKEIERMPERANNTKFFNFCCTIENSSNRCIIDILSSLTDPELFFESELLHSVISKNIKYISKGSKSGAFKTIKDLFIEKQLRLYASNKLIPADFDWFKQNGVRLQTLQSQDFQANYLKVESFLNFLSTYLSENPSLIVCLKI